MSSVKPLGRWWASLPKERLPADPDLQKEIAGNWQDPWGDRRQELVFIGAGLDKAAITAALDAALVVTSAFEPVAWQQLKDPFPGWVTKAA